MFDFLIDPVTITCLLLVGFSWFLRQNSNARNFLVSIIVLVIYILLSSPMLANGLTNLLESKYTVSSCESVKPGAIILLGGGVRNDVSAGDEIEKLKLSSIRRTLAAYRLAKKYPDLPVIVSGGHGTSKITEADLMYTLLNTMGVSSSRLLKDGKSLNTWQNAENTKIIIQKLNINSVFIVTSALHMPRAAGVFKNTGLDVCAHPVDRLYINPRLNEMLIPQTSALTKTKNALHEILGYLWYYFSGKL